MLKSNVKVKIACITRVTCACIWHLICWNIAPALAPTILERLEEKGMIILQEKKGWLGKSVEIHATQKGQDELESRIAQMQDRWGEMIALQKAGDKGKMKGFMDDNRSFLPMMMFFGIMDMMMFSAMFSMIGASAGDYVPADQMPDAGAGDSGDAGDFDFDIGF